MGQPTQSARVAGHYLELRLDSSYLLLDHGPLEHPCEGRHQVDAMHS